MARTEYDALQFANKGLSDVVKLFNDEQRTYYTSFTKIKNNRDQTFRLSTHGDLPPATAFAQGTAIPVVNFQTPYSKDIVPVRVGNQVPWDNEVEVSDLYGIISQTGPKLLSSVIDVMEQSAANLFNLATSTAYANYLTPDGVALASASHLSGSGLQSNLATGAALSYTSVEDMAQLFLGQKSHEGRPLNWRGKFKLLVGTAKAGIANRVVSAQKVAGTNYNDPSWASGMVSEVIVNPYFTSTTAFMGVAEGSYNPLIMVVKRAPKMTAWKEDARDGNSMGCVATFIAAPRDFRGVIYNAGA